MTRVLIAAPTPMLRAGLRTLLAGPALELVAETATLVDATIDLSNVDVVVVADEALLADAARALPGNGRLALVVLAEDERLARVLRRLPLNGWAIVAPDAASNEIQAAVTAAAQGLVTLPRSLAERLLGQPSTTALAEPLAEPLTARELEVLALLSQGLSNKLIARQLQISEHTVKFHVSSLFTKLNASSRTDAVSRGARQGLIAL